MAHNESHQDLTSSPGKKQGFGLLPLHEAALKLAGMGLNRSQNKTRDLVAMLLSHGARAWRSGQPTAILHLYVKTPGGKPPVRLRLR